MNYKQIYKNIIAKALSENRKQKNIESILVNLAPE